MKPNFMIAMYCLAIILTRPKVLQSVVIGLLVGLVSQLPMLNATPLVNIASEMLGALVCGLLVTAFVKVAADNKAFQNVAAPAIITFLSTVVSGYTFALYSWVWPWRICPRLPCSACTPSWCLAPQP